MQSIKFRASFIQPETYGLAKVKEVEFKLGEGPCGRFVETLAFRVTDGLLVVTQTSHLTKRPYPPFAGNDAFEMAQACKPRWFGLVGSGIGYDYNMRVYETIRTAIKAWRDTVEIKEFVYKLSDVHGRIEALR
jgi:hypothetical protein